MVNHPVSVLEKLHEVLQAERTVGRGTIIIIKEAILN